MKFRTPHDEDENEANGVLAAIDCRDESLTVQSAVENSDINVIVRRFGADRGGVIPVQPVDPRFYGDFSDVPDLRTALDLVRDANDKFAVLPAEMRARFDNDPAKLWAFVTNAANFEQAVELGLLRRVDDLPADKPDVEPPV